MAGFKFVYLEHLKRMERDDPDRYRLAMEERPTLVKLARESRVLKGKNLSALLWYLDWRDYHSVLRQEDLFEQLAELRGEVDPRELTERSPALLKEALDRWKSQKSMAGQDFVLQAVGSMLGESVLGHLGVLRLAGSAMPAPRFREEVGSVVRMIGLAIIPPDYRQEAEAVLADLSNVLFENLKDFAELSGHLDAATEAAMAGVNSKALLEHLKRGWASEREKTTYESASGRREKLLDEDIWQSIQVSMLRGLRHWRPAKNPAVSRHLATWGKHGAFSDLRDNLTKPQEELASEPVGDEVALESSTSGRGLGQRTSLELLMATFKPTPAQRVAIERRLAEKPLSGSQRNALHRWLRKMRQVQAET